MLLLRTTIFSFCLIFLIALLSLSRIGATEAKTAVLFGATGAVGNEVLRAILANNQIFTTLILVGRRPFSPKVNDLLSSSSDDHPLEVIKVEDITDLGIVDQHDELAAMEVDACFIAVGNAFPQQSDLYDWHFVDVTMAEAMTRLCVQMQTTVITLFTAIDSDQPDPEPYSEEELTKTGTPMGWWPVLAGTMRMMGWKEKAVATAAVKKATAAVKIPPPSIRIFQPSNIITKEMRYGWLDWTVFNFHAIFDPWLPTRYHSVTTELLATAMVTDSVHILSGKTPSASTTTVCGDVGVDGATRFTYKDFVRIVAGEDVGEEKTEL